MTALLDKDSLNALKIAFSYMPQENQVSRIEFGHNYDRVIKHIHQIRELLAANGVDPDTIFSDTNPPEKAESAV